MTYLEQLLGRYLSIRPRSEQEIRRYLAEKRKKISVDDAFIENLVSKYKNLGYINDVNFAEALTHSLTVNKAKGRQVLAMKLKFAGVEKDVIRAALETIDPEDTRKSMERRLEKFGTKWQSLSDWERKGKAYNKLLASGFSSSEIRPFLDEWLKKR